MRPRLEAPVCRPISSVPSPMPCDCQERDATARRSSSLTGSSMRAPRGSTPASSATRSRWRVAAAQVGPGQHRLRVRQQEAEAAGVGQLEDEGNAGEIGHRRRLRLVAVEDQGEVEAFPAQGGDGREEAPVAAMVGNGRIQSAACARTGAGRRQGSDRPGGRRDSAGARRRWPRWTSRCRPAPWWTPAGCVAPRHGSKAARVRVAPIEAPDQAQQHR